MQLPPSPRRRRLGLLVALLGLAAVVFASAQAAELRTRLAPGRLLIAPFGISALADGRFIVGSIEERIHVYAASGELLHTWHVPEMGRDARIGLSETGRIQVAPGGSERLLEYDLEGALLADREDADARRRLGEREDRSFRLPSGVEYRIEGGRILKTSGQEVQVLVRGFADHFWLTAHLTGVGVSLLLGVVALIGGVVATASRPRVASP